MIIDILHHTPVWVFAVFAVLVYVGLQRVRSGEIPRGQLLTVPIAMAGFSLFGLCQSFGDGLVPVVAWGSVYAAALAAAWVLPPRTGVQYSAASKRFRVPGSWLPLALMMTIFFTRYVVAVLLAMHPSLHRETWFVAAVGAAYGLSSGCFAARALMIWRSAFHDKVAASPVALAA